MTLWILRWIGAACLALAASIADAAQNRTASPDDTVSFSVSSTNVTRISVKGDRIRRIVNDESAFEMMNDEETGDVFLRAVGPAAKPERGFLVTESGITIGYSFKVVAKAVEPVIIEVKGRDTAPDTTHNAEVGGVGFSDDVANWAAEIIRSVVADHVIGRLPKGKDRAVFARASGSGWRARVLVASADDKPRTVYEREFAGGRVRAVYIVKRTLAAQEKTFVVVVEER